MLPAGAEGGPKNYTLGRLGVRPELYQQLAGQMVTTFNPFAQGPGLNFNSNLAETRWQTLNDLFGALIVDPHSLLADAWAAAKDLPPDSQAWKRLSAAPEDEATFAARPAEWKDPGGEPGPLSSGPSSAGPNTWACSAWPAGSRPRPRSGFTARPLPLYQSAWQSSWSSSPCARASRPGVGAEQKRQATCPRLNSIR